MTTAGVSLSALNNTGLLLGNGAGQKRRIKPSELGLDCEHSVVWLSAISTKFGRAILCELENSMVILPGRFANTLSQSDLDALNEKELFVVYKGSCSTKHKPTSLIEFREKPPQQQQQQQQQQQHEEKLQ